MLYLMVNIFNAGPVLQNTRVPDEESANALLNPGQLLKKKIQIKNCSPREICRDLVGRIFL